MFLFFQMVYQFGRTLFRMLQTKISFQKRLGSTINKPLNILVKTKSTNEYQNVLHKLSAIVEKDRYTIYHLTDENFSKGLWVDTCALLFYELRPTESQLPFTLFPRQGNCIVYAHEFCDEQLFSKSNLKCSEELYDVYETEEAHISVLKSPLLSIENNLLRDLLSKMNIAVEDDVEHDNPVSYHAYLFNSQNNFKLNDSFRLENQKLHCKDRTLEFVEEFNKSPAEQTLQIKTTPSFDLSFDHNLFVKSLTTSSLGRVVLYADAVESTQSLITAINPTALLCDGFLVTARQQTQGKGRHGNQWLSPDGCMMFSINFRVAVDSNLGRSLPLVQHVAVVAFVHSVRQRLEYADLELNIKWPNDIYVQRCIKIGGVIVNSVFMDGAFRITIGMGVNVANQRPTACLNSFLNDSKHLKGLTIEEAMAGTLNTLEEIVQCVQEEGVDAFKKLYYKYWLHQETEVTLECHDNKKASIVGIDDYGYLRVRLDNEIVVVQPDGNSFDMCKNMIVLKQ